MSPFPASVKLTKYQRQRESNLGHFGVKSRPEGIWNVVWRWIRKKQNHHQTSACTMKLMFLPLSSSRFSPVVEDALSTGRGAWWGREFALPWLALEVVRLMGILVPELRRLIIDAWWGGAWGLQNNPVSVPKDVEHAQWKGLSKPRGRSDPKEWHGSEVRWASKWGLQKWCTQEPDILDRRFWQKLCWMASASEDRAWSKDLRAWLRTSFESMITCRDRMISTWLGYLKHRKILENRPRQINVLEFA